MVDRRRRTSFEIARERIAAIWLAGRGDQKRQVLARRGVEHRLQVRMHRDCQRDASLFLLHREYAVADMLPPYLYDITTPLRRVEQQCEREARLRPDRMMRLELRNLVLGPGVIAITLDRALLDVCRRVRAQPSAFDGELTKRAQRHEPTAGGMRRLSVQQRLDPFRWQ